MRRESDGSSRRLRRGTIAFNPKQMTYRNENTVHSTAAVNDSVFSQILVRDFFNEEAVSPECSHSELSATETPELSDGEGYWWNSKANRRYSLLRSFILENESLYLGITPHRPSRLLRGKTSLHHHASLQESHLPRGEVIEKWDRRFQLLLPNLPSLREIVW